MIPEIGTAAASSKERFEGLGASLSVRIPTYSVNEPSQIPNTASPGWKPVTLLPTASMVPARLRPGLRYFGLRSPKPATRIGYGRPAMMCQVPRSTLAAYSDEDLLVCDRRLVHHLEPEDVLGDGAVGVMNDRHHRRHPKSLGRRHLDF